MKKTCLAVLFATLSVQPLAAQKFTWKDLFLTAPAFTQTRQDAQKQVEDALIAKLQEADRRAQEEGELRAYQFDPDAVLRIHIEAPSYVPVNYNRENAANCLALLLDNEGTVLLNETCRKALMHTHEKLTFTVDLGNLLPGRFLKISNYPRRSILLKRNYALAALPLTQAVKKDLPEIKSPVFVAKRERLLGAGKKYILPRPLSTVFDGKTPQKLRERFAKVLPAHFTAQLQGFK